MKRKRRVGTTAKKKHNKLMDRKSSVAVKHTTREEEIRYLEAKMKKGRPAYLPTEEEIEAEMLKIRTENAEIQSGLAPSPKDASIRVCKLMLPDVKPVN